MDRFTFRKMKAERREQERKAYQEYREQGGRNRERQRQAEAQAGGKVTAPQGPDLATPKPPNENANL